MPVDGVTKLHRNMIEVLRVLRKLGLFIILFYKSGHALNIGIDTIAYLFSAACAIA